MNRSPDTEHFAANTNEMLPERIAVTEEQLAQFKTCSDFSALAHELYKEAAGVVLACAHVRIGKTRTLPRNHAILAALLVRIYKFMRSTAVLVAGDPGCRETVYALNRCIGETVINLQFLMIKDDAKLFDDFVEKSLGPEKEMLTQITAQIERREWKAIPMENRMLASISRVFQRSGVDPANFPMKHQSWGESVRRRLETLDWPLGYAFLYRVNSHAVHGTWVDLLTNHLQYVGPDQFEVDPEFSVVDSRQLSPVVRLALDAAHQYVAALATRAQGSEPLLDRIADLQERNELVSVRFEDHLQKSRVPEDQGPQT